MEAETERWRLVATLVSSTLFLVPATIGKIVEWIVKGTNPSGVDVNAGLAYLQPLLISAFLVFIIWLLAAVMLNLRVQKVGGSAAARLPWWVFVTQMALLVVFAISSLAVNAITGG